MLDYQQLTKSDLCLGRESNPHGLFGPRDFRTTMAFATKNVCGLDYSFTIGLPFRCAVSSLCTFLLLEAWLKIAFGVIR